MNAILNSRPLSSDHNNERFNNAAVYAIFRHVCTEITMSEMEYHDKRNNSRNRLNSIVNMKMYEALSHLKIRYPFTERQIMKNLITYVLHNICSHV